MATTLAPPRPKAYDNTFWKPISLWLTTTDHKLIGIMYMVTGFLSFLVGGIFALIMRLQLSTPNGTVLTADQYNELVSSHGVTMIFFFVTVFLTGIANYFVPIMIGARDMAFPRVNLLGFWLIPVSILVYYTGFFVPGGTLSAGWTGYPPLTELEYSTGLGTDLWIFSLVIWAISGIMASTNFLTTIVALRAPGMTLTRLPLFVWAQISTSILLLLVGAPLAAAMILLEMDRRFGTHFFATTGGRPVLYQHLFWFFGHPEVYIMILPGFGMISEIIPIFSRKPIFGYGSMVAALFSIVFLSMAVWAHHMFTVGMNIYVETFFMVMTMLIAVPTGIKFFNWIATAWKGSIEFKLPMKFAFGFLATFLIGGITGIYLSSVPVDTQLHQSYYVVAHLHYVLFGGSVFTIFAGIYYWFPKVTGRFLNETLGEWNFWTMFIGFNGTFLVMHTLGLEGMPRRIYTYPGGFGEEGWGATNMFITIMSFVIAFSVLIFMINVIWSWRRGEPAGDDPWEGNTLEWATSSPPAPYNFERVPPIRSFMPLRDIRMARELQASHAAGESGGGGGESGSS
ncbi:MAG TPA: cytochrome c oxidase subunit I [Candidatus Dormibacteraeota bacterium]|jgi:cytochrome c oxidase subunit 1|nr:cytochrome c oxidase subunit I [Candidatus Dormibacteraeota bacterium]